MAPRTHSQVEGQAKTFMGPMNELVYYEDLYGEQTSDQAFDRMYDYGEDDTSSDEKEDSKKWGTKKSMDKSFLTPTAIPGGRKQYDKVGKIGRFKTAAKGTSTQNRFNGSFAFTKEQEKISNPPSATIGESRRAKRGKLLVTRTFGIFTPPSPELSHEMINTAGEALDGLLGANATLDFDDVFHTLDEAASDPDTSLGPNEKSASFDAKAQPPLGRGIANIEPTTEVASVINPEGNEAGSDGDIEDNATSSDAGDVHPKRKGMRGKGPRPRNDALVKRKGDEANEAIEGVRRRSIRVQEKLKKAESSKEIPVSPASTSSSVPEAKQSDVGTRDGRKLTARGALIQSKARKKSAETRSDLHRLKGRRANGKGKHRSGLKMRTEHAVVEIPSDETNIENYDRHY